MPDTAEFVIPLMKPRVGCIQLWSLWFLQRVQGKGQSGSPVMVEMLQGQPSPSPWTLQTACSEKLYLPDCNGDFPLCNARICLC